VLDGRQPTPHGDGHGLARRHRTGVGTTYWGRDPELLAAILPLVDYIEVTPDVLAVMGPQGLFLPGDVISELRDIGRDAMIVVHGVGLSIGTATGYSTSYLHLLDALVEQVDVAWHSEHLGYTMVGGQFLNAMFTLPRTREAFDLVCSRVEEIQARYGLPFSLENVVHLLPDPAGEYSEAEFLNEITGATGCGVLLDAYNLCCDAHNYALDVEAFLAELHLETVREVHVAGGVTRGSLMLDVHSRQIAPDTAALARTILDGAPNVGATVYEVMPEATRVLGAPAIAAELESLGPWARRNR
jgi:uncharacterized protein (UPF0276 family)